MQYGNMPQEGLQLNLPYNYYFINLTKCIQKIISLLGGCLGAVTSWYMVKNMPI